MHAPLRIRTLVQSLAVATWFLLSGCSGTGSTANSAPAPVNPSGLLTITPGNGGSTQSVFYIPNTSALIFTVSSPTGSVVSVQSADSSIASVTRNSDGSYTISPIRAGSTTITVADGPGKSSTLLITVPSPLTVPTPTTALLGVGSTQTFAPSESNYSGTFSIISNSQPGVATITQTSPGIFTAQAVSGGTTTVTFSDSYGQQQTVVIVVTVTQATIT